MGKRTRIGRPLQIQGHGNITFGNDVVVGKFTWLAAMPLTGKKPSLIFKDGVRIGNFNHIYATSYIEFGEGALVADKVYITDNFHDYSDVTVPIKDQQVLQLNNVVIGGGCWIGENVSILGASIGRNSVVGANSVVTKNIPDYCIAVGSPATVIKKFCFDTKSWKKTNNDGSFID